MPDAVAERLADRQRWVDIEGLARRLYGEATEESIRAVRGLRERGLPARRLPDKNGRLSKRLWFDIYEADDWIAREGVRV